MPALQRPALRQPKMLSARDFADPVGLDRRFRKLPPGSHHPGSRSGSASSGAQLRLGVARCATFHTRRAQRGPGHHRDRSGQVAAIRSVIAKAAFPIDPPLLRFWSLQRFPVRVALSASCRLGGRSRFGVGIGPRIPHARANRCPALAVFRSRCFSKCALRRVTTESELSRTVAVGVKASLAEASGGAAHVKHLQSCQRTNE